MVTGAAARRPAVDVSPARALRHPTLVLFLLAFAVRLVLWLVATAGPGRVIWVPDSLEYDRLGRALALHGVFSQAVTPPFTPDVQRLPLFPLQVALGYLLAGGRPAVGIGLATLGNVLLGALTVVIVARLAETLGGRRAGVIAGIVLALDLTAIVYSVMLLSEALFTVLLAGALLALARYCHRPAPALALLTGTSLGLAALARPIGLPLLPALAPVFLLARGRARWRLASRDLALCGLVFLALLTPWNLRTRAAGGDAVGAAQVAINAYFHRGALIEAARTGRDPEVVRAEMKAAFQREAAACGWSEADQIRVMRERATRLIADNWLLYTRLQLQGMAHLLGPETDALFDATGLRPAPHDGPSPGVRALWQGIGMAQLAVDYALATLGLALLVRARRWPALALLLLPALYFLAVSGPEAYARFRVPLMPEVAVLAGLGLTWWRRQPRHVQETPG